MIPFGKISAMQDRMSQMPKLKLPVGRQTVVLSEGWKKGIADQFLWSMTEKLLVILC